MCIQHRLGISLDFGSCRPSLEESLSWVRAIIRRFPGRLQRGAALPEGWEHRSCSALVMLGRLGWPVGAGWVRGNREKVKRALSSISFFINEVYLICRSPRGKNNTLEPQMSVSGGLKDFSHLNDILGK